MDIVGQLSPKIKKLSFEIVKEGADANWHQVKQGLRELAFICKVCGLKQGDFNDIRRELILAIEHYQPLAKTQIELQERTNATIH